MSGGLSMRSLFSLATMVMVSVTCASARDVYAQGDPNPAPPTQCASAQYRQFDFWVGDWEVRGTDGARLGSNQIEKIQGGCVLQEHWTGASGDTGTSFNIYDFTRDVWHQTWVSRASLLVLEGGLQGTTMVLEGTTHEAGGREVLNRITWTPVSHDEVTQVWETSGDGEQWNVIFHGIYRRK